MGWLFLMWKKLKLLMLPVKDGIFTKAFHSIAASSSRSVALRSL